MRDNKSKKLKCVACTFVAVEPLFFGYIFCPKCGSRLVECWVDAERNSDTVGIKHPVHPDTVLVTDVSGSTFTEVGEEGREKGRAHITRKDLLERYLSDKTQKD